MEQIQNPAWMRILPAEMVKPPPPPVAVPVPASRPIPVPSQAPPPLVPIQAPIQARPSSSEVRPALPVESSASGEVFRPLSAEPVATPFRPPVRTTPPPAPVMMATPLPVLTPVAPPMATPVPVAVATPTPTPVPVVEAPPATPSNTIRITSGEPVIDPVEAALQRANSFYSRKMFDLAIPEYESYLSATQPKAAGRDAALFRVAECQRILERAPAAQAGYERLTEEFSTGEFAGSGAYRLGEMFFAKNIYALAVPQFEKASANAANDSVRLSADFYLARALDEMKENARALEAYSKVLASPAKENPYKDYAQISSARLAVQLGDKKRAAEIYTQIAQSGGTDELKAEGGVKAAALWVEAGDNAKARPLLEAVASNGKAGNWKSVAKMALLELDYQAGKYTNLAQLADKLDSFPVESRPKALLIAANSRRQLGQHAKALELYDRLQREFPNASEVKNARFQRLVSLYETNGPTLEDELNQFLLVTSDPKERNQATMLKAESLFKAERFAEAVNAYRTLPGSDLPDDLRSESLYKFAWCLAQSGQPAEAVQRFSDFIQQYPKHAYLTQAYLQRALAHKAAKAYPAAMKDFDTLIEKYPESKEREMALLQKALLFGEQKDYPKMSATFAQLLADYPKTAAAAQANFWIGWAAYESKDYKAALPALEKARELDAKTYADRANLRVILSYYYLEDPDAVAKQIAEHPVANLPGEVYQWLAGKYIESKNYAKAEKFLEPLVAGTLGPVPAETYLSLAQARLEQKKYAAAGEAVKKFLEVARDPLNRTRGLLLQAETEMGQTNYDAAQKLVDECMLLQPEGQWNAQSRLLSGRILAARGNQEEAARTFMTIAVLYDDPKITPDALRRAAAAYRKAGNAMESQNALRELEKRYPGQLQKKESESL